MKKTLALTLFAAALALAHDGVEHLRGTVKEASAITITIETAAHKSITVMLDASTKFTAQSSIKDVKVGQVIGIDAKDAADHKMMAVAVKLGVSAAAPAEKSEHAHHGE